MSYWHITQVLCFLFIQVLELVWRPKHNFSVWWSHRRPLCLIEDQCDTGRAQAVCWTRIHRESWNKLKLSFFNELHISDSSEDFGAGHQYSRKRCTVILLQKIKDLAWAQMEQKTYESIFVSFQYSYIGYNRTPLGFRSNQNVYLF